MAKRFFDVCASAVGLAILLPFFAVVAVLIKLTSKGPVFFRQTRVGLDGREFDVFKFRTMVQDAPSRGKQITVYGDPRITGFGRYLRKAKLDEFPQLINVLAGDMSLVGPRPEVPRYVAMYNDDQRQVLSVRPGVTDYASITYFDENAVLAASSDPERTYIEEVMPHKIQINLNYLKRRSLLEDFRIILATAYLAFNSLAGRYARQVQVLLDVGVVCLSVFLAYQIRFEGDLPPLFHKQMILVIPYLALTRLLLNVVFGVYRIIWRYISVYEVWKFVKACVVLSVVLLIVRWGYQGNNPYFRIPVSIIMMEFFLSFVGMVLLRFFRRWLNDTTGQAGTGALPTGDIEKVIIVGAGENGHRVAREIRLRKRLNLSIIGFVDDDPDKNNLEVDGFKVLGGLDQLALIFAKHRFSQALLAISGLPLERRRQLNKTCVELGVKLRLMPGASDLISGHTQVSKVRDVSIEDLLGRDVNNLTADDPMLKPVYGGRRILITGAGGSIGSELCRQIASLVPEELILVEKDENNLFLIRGELLWRFPALKVSAHILDVRIPEKLEKVFAATRPHVVIHAAAYKHVPLMEENPFEAIENNVIGTRNVVEVADRHGVETFVMLSTDKAVNPTSIMGATKRIAELIVRQHAETHPRARYVSVRFGNVLGSRGSVIPTFKTQIERGGPVTVTHPDVVRFFMTIPEASQLVLRAGTQGAGGDVFVLDMGEPVKIVDLARDMIRLSGFSLFEIPIVFTGLRPGEKLFEELLVAREGTSPTGVDKVFVSRTELRDLDGFTRQVDDLIRQARDAGTVEIRSMLANMDIGLREPDCGGEN